MHTPLISVIMPVFNAEKYIKKALKSILNQTERDIEIVIVDDCGIDNSMSIVKQMVDERIIVLKNDTNRGIAYSRNRALENVQGKYIAIMDDDDIAPLNRLEIESTFLEKNQDIDVVGGQMIEIDENDREVTYPTQVSCNPKCVWSEFLFKDRIMNGTAMMKTEFIKKNSILYKDGYWGMEDYKFWTECSSIGNITNINQVLLYWRNIFGNETQRVRNYHKSEKEEIYAKIQLEALALKGFSLDRVEQQVFIRCFDENSKRYTTLDELKILIQILHKLIRQAENLYPDRSKEFEFVCHRMFGRLTENSEIWTS